MKSGARSAEWRLAPRSREIADSLRGLIPGYSERDEVMLRLLALVLTRIELAETWLSEQETIFQPRKRGEPLSIVKEMARWESQAAKLCSQLGLSPAARARIGAEAAQGRVSAALEDHLRDSYGQPVEDGGP